MTNYTAIVTEKNSPNFGKSFANTKIGQYKGLSKDEFYNAVRYNQIYTFEIKEMPDYSKHREFLNDKWCSASY